MRKHNNGFMQANNRRKQKHIQVIFGAFFFLGMYYLEILVVFKSSFKRFFFLIIILGNTIFVTSASLKCFNVFHLFCPNNPKAQVKK